MALVQIEKVQLAAGTQERLHGFHIDTPAADATSDVFSVEIAGWVLGRSARVTDVEVHAEGTVLRRIAIDQQRADVAATFSDVPGADVCGFRFSVGLLGLEPGVDLQLRAVLEDKTRVRLGAIAFAREPLRSGFAPTLRPLMLTTLGRAGTTWTMRVLSEHPQIVVHRWHPYELRFARYWMHNLKVLSDPSNPHQSAQADFFQTDKAFVGHNPFYPHPMSTTPGLLDWVGKTRVEALAAFCQRTAEECYQRIATAQGQTEPVFFAEKHRADYLPWLFWELYPDAREIFLVRDFRDVVSSMLAFNTKHNRQIFGHERLASDAEFARFVRNGPVRLLAKNWPKRQDRAHLIRYEDLIEQPTETLRGVLAYLELAHDDATIDGMLERAMRENPEMQRHRTSGAVSSSIGRWRESLDPGMQAVCSEVFGDVLQQFGYAV